MHVEYNIFYDMFKLSYSSIPLNLPTASPLSDQIFVDAAVIFQQLREEKPVTQQLLQYGKKTDTPLPLNGDKVTEMKAFQLAFSTLKCTMALFILTLKRYVGFLNTFLG